MGLREGKLKSKGRSSSPKRAHSDTAAVAHGRSGGNVRMGPPKKLFDLRGAGGYFGVMNRNLNLLLSSGLLLSPAAVGS